MRRIVALGLTAALTLGLAALGPQAVAPVSAAPTIEGREWNELYPTTGLTWSQVATVCPTDGATPCDGTVGGRNLSGWVWATADQVRALMARYAPELAAGQDTVSTFGAGVGFLNEFRWTGYTALTYFYEEHTAGWTASRDEAGLPIGGGASYQTPFFAGSVGLGSAPDTASAARGVFLWRPLGVDHTPPRITPVVEGQLGTGGWYRSTAGLTWSVEDAESAIVSSDGCDPASVDADTAGETFTCTARSAGTGGAATATVTIRRDATPPTLTCAGRPRLGLGDRGTVTASVVDATSGVAAATVSTSVSATTAGPGVVQLTAVDRAGNTGSATCGYDVSVPTCAGRQPTIVGTGGNDVLVGTAGPDVIVALAGIDQVDGGGGRDVICGGAGADHLEGGLAADRLFGDDGDDELEGGAGPDELDGGAGVDSLRGDGGADRCTSGERRSSSCVIV